MHKGVFVLFYVHVCCAFPVSVDKVLSLNVTICCLPTWISEILLSGKTSISIIGYTNWSREKKRHGQLFDKGKYFITACLLG